MADVRGELFGKGWGESTMIDGTEIDVSPSLDVVTIVESARYGYGDEEELFAVGVLGGRRRERTDEAEQEQTDQCSN